jgi:hypothetical protein
MIAVRHDHYWFPRVVEEVVSFPILCDFTSFVLFPDPHFAEVINLMPLLVGYNFRTHGFTSCQLTVVTTSNMKM